MQYLFDGIFCSYRHFKKLPFLTVFFWGSLSVFSQQSSDKKDIISITSSFKPSIVRTGKLEFYAEPVRKDTSSYRFSYSPAPLVFSTPMTSFTISPLALGLDSAVQDATVGYAKIGFGNFSTPFASLGYQQNKGADRFAVHLDQLSSSGKLPDQQFSTSSLGLTYKRNFSANQSASFFGGYTRSGYRLYGFDHNQYSFDKETLKQQFNRVHAGAEYRLVSGDKANTLYTPVLRVDHLSTNKDLSEYRLKLGLPVEHVLNGMISLSASPVLEYTSLRFGALKGDMPLFQMPLRSTFTNKTWNIRAGLIPYIADKRLTVLPEIFASYRLANTGIQLRAGIDNALSINSFGVLSEINPFLFASNALSAAQQTTYHAGLNWLNEKGLQLRFKGGFIQYKNHALFSNMAGNTEKDFEALIESSLQAFTVETEFDFLLSSSLKFGGSLKFLSFQKQQDYTSPFGLLPLEAKAHVDWKPLPALRARFTVFAWQGANYQFNNKEEQIKGAVDANINLEYNLDKKWVLWIDLNNIANQRYQRWYGYTTLGFNAIGGFRYLFNN